MVLDKLVKERTAEVLKQKNALQETYEEINQINEEVAAQKDNLAQLNEKIIKQKDAIEIEPQKADELLLNILPLTIAQELKKRLCRT